MERKRNTTTPTWSCRSSQPVVSVLLLHLHPAEENMTSLYAGTSLKDRPFSTTNVSLYQPHTNTYGLRAEHRTNKRYFQLRKFVYTPPRTTTAKKTCTNTYTEREKQKRGGGWFLNGRGGWSNRKSKYPFCGRPRCVPLCSVLVAVVVVVSWEDGSRPAMECCCRYYRMMMVLQCRV